MQKNKYQCQIYKGWYRHSLVKSSMVWHRVNKVDSVLCGRQIAHTVCGRKIATTKCDFNSDPDHKCIQCKKFHEVIVETGRGFVPIRYPSIEINTKADAVRELKRLLKPRIYYLKIFGIYGIRITAKWESDISIDIGTETEIITKKRTKRVMTMYEIQADLDRFKSAIDCLIDASTILARKDKKKKQLKGRLTEYEDQCYFEELLYKAEK